jgi:hypothetical protein
MYVVHTYIVNINIIDIFIFKIPIISPYKIIKHFYLKIINLI